MARDEVIRELCDERIVSNFDTIVNLNTSVYSNEKGKKNLAFFFLTRLLTDSLIKLSGQNKRKEKKKTRVLFRITKPIHALILSTFQIRNLIYNSYHFRLHAGHLLLYFPNYQPLTASQSFFSKDSLF